MTKKVYEKPKMKVFNLQKHSHLLAGSGGEYTLPEPVIPIDI